MSGFTLGAVANRIKAIDSAIQWKNYTALATLARLRGTKKAALETLVFGKKKPSKDFNNAWSRAGKVFAMFYANEKEARAAVTTMTVDDAHKEVLRVIDSHMAALGVNGKNAYDGVIEYACKDDIPVAETEPETETDAETPTAPELQTEPEPEVETEAPRRSLTDVMAHVMELSTEEKHALLAFLQQDLAIDAGEVEPLRIAA